MSKQYKKMTPEEQLEDSVANALMLCRPSPTKGYHQIPEHIVMRLNKSLAAHRAGQEANARNHRTSSTPPKI